MEENTKTRYSDEELEEFRGIINEMLDKARAEYATLRKVIMNAGGNDILDTAPTFKTVEDDGAFQLSKEEASALAQRQYKFIQNLEAALVRIENKSYGICRVTGKLIPKERLRLVPHATLTVEAKEMLARQGIDEDLRTRLKGLRVVCYELEDIVECCKFNVIESSEDLGVLDNGQRLDIRLRIGPHQSFVSIDLAGMCIDDRLEVIVDLVLIKDIVNDPCFFDLGVVKTVSIEPLEVDLLAVLSGEGDIDESLVIFTDPGLSLSRAVIYFHPS